MTTGRKYDFLWDEVRCSLYEGTLRVDPVPVDGDPRWGLSLILLPPAHAAESVRSRR